MVRHLPRRDRVGLLGQMVRLSPLDLFHQEDQLLLSPFGPVFQEDHWTLWTCSYINRYCLRRCLLSVR